MGKTAYLHQFSTLVAKWLRTVAPLWWHYRDSTIGYTHVLCPWQEYCVQQWYMFIEKAVFVHETGTVLCGNCSPVLNL